MHGCFYMVLLLRHAIYFEYRLGFVLKDNRHKNIYVTSIRVLHYASENDLSILRSKFGAPPNMIVMHDATTSTIKRAPDIFPHKHQVHHIIRLTFYRLHTKEWSRFVQRCTLSNAELVGIFVHVCVCARYGRSTRIFFLYVFVVWYHLLSDV